MNRVQSEGRPGAILTAHRGPREGEASTKPLPITRVRQRGSTGEPRPPISIPNFPF